MIRITCSVFLVLLSLNVIAKPDVIAHRGASGYLPEHTLESLILAHAQGADYIEQDLVLSKDLVPVVLHDIHLETVTDVEHVFPQRKRADGRYYAFDFTLAELKTLRVHERADAKGRQVFPQRFDGQSDFRIATFQQHIDLINQLNKSTGKNVGFYPEIKSPHWHMVHEADISQIVLKILRANNLDDASAKIYVQCFDFVETQRLRNVLGAKVKLVQLIGENDWGESASDYDYLRTKEGLSEIAMVAQGIGPWIPQLIDSQTMKITSLVNNAHSVGLKVHPYTFRKEQLPEGIDATTMLNTLFQKVKVDGIFTDFTDTVVQHLE